jgi:hypothetical protein
VTSWLTITVTSRAQVPLVSSGDGPALIANNDQNNTIWLSDDFGVQAGASNSAPLPPGATVTVDGEHNVYAVTQPGISVQVFIIPGGLNFFQQVSLLLKTLLIAASLGNGIFVYSSTPSLGDLIASIVSAAGDDPFLNPTIAGIVSYGAAGAYSQLLGGSLAVSNATEEIIEIGTLTSGLTLIAEDNSASPNYVAEIFAMYGAFYARITAGLFGAAIAVMSATAGTHDGDSWNAGFTGPITAWDPTTSGGSLVPETWKVPTTTGFSSIAGYQPVAYSMQSNGLVAVTGIMEATAGYVAGTTIWTMPAAYRPPTDITTVGVGINHAGAFSFQWALINPSGSVTLTANVANGDTVVFVGQPYRLV